MELTVDQMLQQGVFAHNAGNLQEAERLYRAILQVQPTHPDANHNLGLIAVSTNQSGVALPLFENAIKVNPNMEQFWLSYVEALIVERQFENAKRALKKGKKKGVAKEKLKALTQKLVSVKAGNIPIQAPSQAEIQKLSNHYQNGQYGDAETLAISITENFPEHQFGWKVLGAILGQTGRMSESLGANQKAVALAPKDAVAHSNLGKTLLELFRLEEAERSCRQAIALKPDFVEAHYNLGKTLQELDRLEEAEASFRQAIALKSDFAEAHSNLGNTLQGLGRLEEAEASYRQAISLKPDSADAHNNLGVTLKKLGRLNDSMDCYKQAIKLKPDYVAARQNLNDVTSAAVPAWHLSMMNDKSRNLAYLEAIKLAVDDGSFVLEIGTGSGLLAMMAAANGAGKVLTCESSKTIADVAKKIIHRNGYGENISVINKKSTDLVIGEDLPRKADLIISEVLSAEFVGEGVRPTTLDANKRLLKKNGTMIPRSGSIRISLLGNSPEISEAVTVHNAQGFDLSKFNSISQSKFNFNLKTKPTFLSKPEDAFSINFYDEVKAVKEEKIIQLRASQDGLCLGLIQWLRVQLYKDIEYENSPGADSSHWPTPVYVFDEPVPVKIGDVLEIRAFLDEDNVWFYHLA